MLSQHVGFHCLGLFILFSWVFYVFLKNISLIDTTATSFRLGGKSTNFVETPDHAQVWICVSNCFGFHVVLTA